MSIYAPLNSEPTPTLQSIEVSSMFQIPSFQIVGLPSQEVAESRERVRSAIESSGFEFPRRRVLINLSPAHIRKRGTGLDLGIALAVLQSHEQDSDEPIALAGASICAWGELGLDGSIKSAGQITRAAFAAWKGGCKGWIVSREDHSACVEALDRIRSAELPGTPPRIIAAENLREAWEQIQIQESKKWVKDLAQTPPQNPVQDPEPPEEAPLLPIPLALARVLAACVSGAHGILLLGPKGTGKSHSLEWIQKLAPSPSALDRLQAILLSELHPQFSRIDSKSNFKSKNETPIRRVGAQVKATALIGSCSASGVRVGEFTLAHGGVLAADELPEWPRDSREALREPLERGKVSLTRTQGSYELPAQFIFAANGNLCPCGESGGNPDTDTCRCKPHQRSAYLYKLSGPVLDRIDLVTLLTSTPLEKRLSQQESFVSAREQEIQLKAWVEKTRSRALSLWGVLPGRMNGPQTEKLLSHHPDFEPTLAQHSLRARHRIFRVALTLAALDGVDEPSLNHLFEATLYRPERWIGK